MHQLASSDLSATATNTENNASPSVGFASVNLHAVSSTLPSEGKDDNPRRMPSLPAQPSALPPGQRADVVALYRTMSIREVDTRRSIATSGRELPADVPNFHMLSLERLRQLFQTNLTNGLDPAVAAARLKREGPNSFTPPPPSWPRKLLFYTMGGFAPILWLALVLSVISYTPLGDPPDPTNLGLAGLLVICIGIQAGFNAFQEWKSAKVMSSIYGLLPSTTEVTRGGERTRAPIASLLPGDLVHLRTGDKVPADMRVIRCNNLEFDKSVLTGESKAVRATVKATSDGFLESHNVALMGTLVVSGEGDAIVVLTGDRTTMGQIAHLSAHTKHARTQLESEIRRFMLIVVSIAMTIAVFVFFYSYFYLGVKYPGFVNISAALINAAGIMVSFVPEGLPVALGLTLTLVALRMSRRNVLVRNLSTIETLDAVDVLLSDKTGTLTTSIMSVVSTTIGDTEHDVPDVNAQAVQQLLAALALCNGASFTADSADLAADLKRCNGNSTDAALLRYAERYSSVMGIRGTQFNKVAEVPFSSQTKWMLGVYAQRAGVTTFGPVAGQQVMIAKGAPDILLPMCSRVMTMSGTAEEMTPDSKERLTGLQMAWSAQGRRCLLICSTLIAPDDKEFLTYESTEEWKPRLTNLTVLGLIGIVDPPRPEIRSTVETCRGAGIRLFMVTGDFSLTAESIARQVGIITTPEVRYRSTMATADGKNTEPAALVLTGGDLVDLNEDDWDRIEKYPEIVFARTTPEQKLRIVTEFRKRDHVVAVTGDGVNDAPALKAANIGIAMGGGTEVAMEAAQVVLLDNNFSSIVAAIESGRLVFDNLKKVLIYLIPGGTMAELLAALSNVLLGLPLPLSAFLMIYISIVTDMFNSSALMFESPESDVLKRKPRNPKKDHLVNGQFLLQAYIVIGIIDTIMAHLMYFWYMSTVGFSPSDLFLSFNNWTDGYKGHTGDQLKVILGTAQSVYFVALVVMQALGTVYAIRTRRRSIFQQPPWSGPKSNRYLFLGNFGSILFAIIIVYIPVFNNVFNTQPIPAQFWFTPLVGALIIITVDEVRKYYVRRGTFLERLAW